MPPIGFRDGERDQQDVGKKYDDGKPKYSLIPPLVMPEYVAVLTFGAAKYGDHNWRLVAPLQDRYYDAMMRHLEAYRSGELLDGESGKHHLAHAMCCLSFMMQDSLEGAKS